MVNPRGWEPDEDKRYKYFFKDMQRAIVLGNILWMGITTRLTEEAGEIHNYAKKALNFRKNIQGYIISSDFIDNKYIEFISKDCDAAGYQLSENKYVFIVGNCDMVADANLKLTFDNKIKKIEKYDIDWSKEEMDVESNEISLSIGSSRLYCFVINS